jgi:hypothetical protein
MLEPESHPFFGTPFCVPDSHAFWRNRASGGESERNGLESASKFERFLASEPVRIWCVRSM